ncbi:MAG TPA: GNAT family N-acetyltransferase [Methylibium sp.]|nr:GNAT family N-acetyltransferase [Methylibium sp.]
MTAFDDLTWRCTRLHELGALELQRIHVARQQVFVVEQACAFQDADAADERSAHLCGWTPDGELWAYARLVDPGVKYAEPSIGRVLTTAAARGLGLGRELVRRAIAEAEARFAGQGLRISAQHRLQRFYEQAGFVSVGEPYLEDDLPHIEMLRR